MDTPHLSQITVRAVIALDPEDGGVLALYSNPGYAPNDFVSGISSQAWEDLKLTIATPSSIVLCWVSTPPHRPGN
ncbi:MAG: hypothetical protein CM1200mP14_09360 [Gammaproteobacteria bacterium]|nr:MAG: hypothetical protein CM1200mP14_09360 [Gammaproteobacteria bacterium]